MAVVPQQTDDRHDPVFGDGFMETLGYLEIVARKVLSGQLKAERKSRKKGMSVEFADHRPYAAGDDFRFIDWSVYFRTEQLFLKLFEEEEDLNIYLLVDCSSSMDFGVPYKFHYARRLAAAIGYLGLSSHDRVSVLPFTTTLGEKTTDTLRIRGKGKIFRLLEFLTSREASGETDLRTSLQSLGTGRYKRGLAIVISDLLDEEGVLAGVNALRIQKFDPYIVHIVSPEEAAPQLLGDIRLLDSESGRTRDVTLTEKLLRQYGEAFGEYCESIERFCRAKEIGYTRCSTEVPFQETIVRMLRRGRLLQ